MKRTYEISQSEKLELSAIYGGGNLADELEAREALEAPTPSRVPYMHDYVQETGEGGRLQGVHPNHARQVMTSGGAIGWQW